MDHRKTDKRNYQREHGRPTTHGTWGVRNGWGRLCCKPCTWKLVFRETLSLISKWQQELSLDAFTRQWGFSSGPHSFSFGLHIHWHPASLLCRGVRMQSSLSTSLKVIQWLSSPPGEGSKPHCPPWFGPCVLALASSPIPPTPSCLLIHPFCIEEEITQSF